MKQTSTPSRARTEKNPAFGSAIKLGDHVSHTVTITERAWKDVQKKEPSGECAELTVRAFRWVAKVTHGSPERAEGRMFGELIESRRDRLMKAGRWRPEVALLALILV